MWDAQKFPTRVKNFPVKVQKVYKLIIFIEKLEKNSEDVEISFECTFLFVLFAIVLYEPIVVPTFFLNF